MSQYIIIKVILSNRTVISIIFVTTVLESITNMGQSSLT